MASKPRSAAGCWTCRLRRKKCDEVRPVCEGCAALEIECLYSDARPAWMDNGPRQKTMADRLKAAVKDRAAWRREKRFLRDIETGAAAISLTGMGTGGSDGVIGGRATHIFAINSSTGAAVDGTTTAQVAPARAESSPPPPSTASTSAPAQTPASAYLYSESSSVSTSMSVSASAPTTPTDDCGCTGVENATATTTTTTPFPSSFAGPSSSSAGPSFNPFASAATASGPFTASSTAWTPGEATLDPPCLDQDRELSLLMMYLDYVFPFLYPFCRPSVLGSGRGWLLVLLMKNKAVFHSALSLASYFMAVVATTTQALQNNADAMLSSLPTPPMPPLNINGTTGGATGGATGGTIGIASDHRGCLTAIATELHKQQELSLRELQRTIAAISRDRQEEFRGQSLADHSGCAERLAESARALESILHLLSFEVVLQRFDSWHVHLDAALALFEQIMGPFAQQSDRSNGSNGRDGDRSERDCAPWATIMAHLSPFRDNLAARQLTFPVPYGSDQAALTFYVSLLLYMDVVTSTVTGQAPRLQRFHSLLVGPALPSPSSPNSGGGGGGGGPPPPPPLTSFALFDPTRGDMFLAIEEVVGIRNWVLRALADTAALAAWKKEAAAQGRLTVAELLARAAPIERGLRAHLAALEANMGAAAAAKKTASHSGSSSGGGIGYDPTAGFYSTYIATAEAKMDEYLSNTMQDGPSPTPTGQHQQEHSYSLPDHAHADSAAHLSIDTVTHIWALAALTYLLVVVNGWQPAADAVRQAADRTLTRLAALPSASCLRVAAWPLCVAGCLATREQRALYPGMVGEICGGELFGTVNEALRIMQSVWAAQDLQAAAGGGGGVGSRGGSSGSGVNSVEWDFARCFNILGRRAFLL